MLAARARAGDAAAFGELVSAQRQAALRVATVVAGYDADDIVQSAAERAWSAIAGLDPDRGFRSWFLAIVANSARNHRRGRWRRRRAELRLVARAADAPHDPQLSAISTAERQRVLAALDRLDPDARLVLALRHFEQLTEREIAEVCGCPVGTVKSRLSRASARLRAELSGGGLSGTPRSEEGGRR